MLSESCATVGSCYEDISDSEDENSQSETSFPAPLPTALLHNPLTWPCLSTQSLLSQSDKTNSSCSQGLSFNVLASTGNDSLQTSFTSCHYSMAVANECASYTTSIQDLSNDKQRTLSTSLDNLSNDKQRTLSTSLNMSKNKETVSVNSSTSLSVNCPAVSTTNMTLFNSSLNLDYHHPFVSSGSNHSSLLLSSITSSCMSKCEDVISELSPSSDNTKCFDIFSSTSYARSPVTPQQIDCVDVSSPLKSNVSVSSINLEAASCMSISSVNQLWTSEKDVTAISSLKAISVNKSEDVSEQNICARVPSITSKPTSDIDVWFDSLQQQSLSVPSSTELKSLPSPVILSPLTINIPISNGENYKLSPAKVGLSSLLIDVAHSHCSRKSSSLHSPCTIWTESSVSSTCLLKTSDSSDVNKSSAQSSSFNNCEHLTSTDHEDEFATQVADSSLSSDRILSRHDKPKSATTAEYSPISPDYTTDRMPIPSIDIDQSIMLVNKDNLNLTCNISSHEVVAHQKENNCNVSDSDSALAPVVEAESDCGVSAFMRDTLLSAMFGIVEEPDGKEINVPVTSTTNETNALTIISPVISSEKAIEPFQSIELLLDKSSAVDDACSICSGETEDKSLVSQPCEKVMSVKTSVVDDVDNVATGEISKSLSSGVITNLNIDSAASATKVKSVDKMPKSKIFRKGHVVKDESKDTSVFEERRLRRGTLRTRQRRQMSTSSQDNEQSDIAQKVAPLKIIVTTKMTVCSRRTRRQQHVTSTSLKYEVKLVDGPSDGLTSEQCTKPNDDGDIGTSSYCSTDIDKTNIESSKCDNNVGNVGELSIGKSKVKQDPINSSLSDENCSVETTNSIELPSAMFVVNSSPVKLLPKKRGILMSESVNVLPNEKTLSVENATLVLDKKLLTDSHSCTVNSISNSATICSSDNASLRKSLSRKSKVIGRVHLQQLLVKPKRSRRRKAEDGFADDAHGSDDVSEGLEVLNGDKDGSQAVDVETESLSADGLESVSTATVPPITIKLESSSRPVTRRLAKAQQLETPNNSQQLGSRKRCRVVGRQVESGQQKITGAATVVNEDSDLVITGHCDKFNDIRNQNVSSENDTVQLLLTEDADSVGK